MVRGVRTFGDGDDGRDHGETQGRPDHDTHHQGTAE
jgi:hypothetical protein